MMIKSPAGDSTLKDPWRLANVLAAMLVILCGLIYVGKTWSPSSYGYVLESHLGEAGRGPDWGVPRPIRSDEWSVVTPLTQAAVNNGFERYNRTSLYGEDLRINYGLPLHDWGIVFKPTMWLYGWVDPAYAYSFHWFAMAALFVVGYAWLFRWLGATPALGFTLAAGLYFTGFVQFWWNEKGPLFALFPWVILPLTSRLPLAWKAVLFYWLAVAWLLANLYPPVQVSLAFVAVVLLYGREPRLFRLPTLAVLGLAAALAAGTAALYLMDYLRETAATLYPGGRNVGGGSVPGRLWLSWLWPAVNFNRDYESLVGANICEIGTVGLYYFLLVACFLDYSRWRELGRDPAARRLVLVLGAGFAAMAAWMALPLPPWAGKILLWNNVQPPRMQYGAGVLLVCLLFVLGRHLGWRLSLGRLAGFCGAVVLGWWLWKYSLVRNRYEDLFILPLALGAFALARWRPGMAHASLATASLLAGVLLFGRFNPLQPAESIFHRETNDITRALDWLSEHNGGVLAVPGLFGAVPNGMGYRSLGHVTATPKLDFWRGRFTDLAPEQFQTIFNRYAHIYPVAEAAPRLIQNDALAVPVSPFQKLGQALPLSGPVPGEVGGAIDGANGGPGHLVLSGWAPWDSPLPAHEIEISPAIPGAKVSFNFRPDLPGATGGKISSLNGFVLDIPQPAGSEPPALCVVARDGASGKRVLLPNPPGLPPCRQTNANKK